LSLQRGARAGLASGRASLLVVPLAAGLPSGAHKEVATENSLRALTAAPVKQLRRVSLRSTLRVPTSLLRASSTNKAPGQMPAQPFFTPLVARHRRRLWHAINVVVA
jgi:hypothetical protein